MFDTLEKNEKEILIDSMLTVENLDLDTNDPLELKKNIKALDVMMLIVSREMQDKYSKIKSILENKLENNACSC